MNNITSNEQRNSETTFLNRDSLQFINGFDINVVNNGSDETRTQALAEVIRWVAVTGLDLTHLADFLGQRHLLQQSTSPIFRAGFHVQ